MCVELGMWEAKLFMGVEKHHSSLAKARKFALKFEEESMTIVHNTPPPCNYFPVCGATLVQAWMAISLAGLAYLSAPNTAR